ncbi:helix-turn-helix transcriptional regulator [Nitrobacter sp.]|uniref:helix-turn-helix transcriptional regulator n=1 Tax=Nitrobacter sp. TaxID=29420 RepID=UPI0029CABB6A|nr:helix-turn-helix transcriptional regulator [Nitrobacter sp.]
MEEAARSTNAYGALLFPIRGRLPDVPRTRTLDTSFDTYVRDGWIFRDERYRGESTLEKCGVVTEFDFTSLEEIKRNAYYQEFLAPVGLRWFAGVKIAAGEDLWSLSIQRTIQDGPFSPSEVTEFSELSTRLSGAAALARALDFARIDAALAAFEISGLAVALIDRMGEVFRINEAADRLIGTDLRIERRRLASFDPAATAALDRSLHDLLWRSSSMALSPPVRLPRRAATRPILAYPLRLPAVTADALAQCRALLVLVDLNTQPAPSEQTLRICFGLSPAEARLALGLAAGQSLNEVAEALGIARETARSQLKAVFSKTNCSRQTELISILTRLLRPMDKEEI